MTRRSPWLDPKGLRVAVAFAVLAAVANGVWILLDNSVPSWDQANYLSTTLQFKRSLDAGGIIDLLRSIHSTDPGHAPLFTVLMLPFFYVFGPVARSGLFLNFLLAPVLYFAAGEIAWIVFRSWIARLVTIALVATMPILVGLYHDVLVDFLLVTLTTVALLLVLKTEGFQRRGMCIALGFVMALGTLTKVTFPLFMVGPLLVVAAQIFYARHKARSDLETEKSDDRPLLINLGATLLVYVLAMAPWYGPNLAPTLDYVSSTTSGPLALGAGPSNPYTFHAVTSFTVGLLNNDLSWFIFLIGVLALALSFGKVRALLRRPLQVESLLRIGFVLAWVLVPYLSVALAHNQDVRLMAAAMPGMAVLVAGALSAIPWARARLTLIGVTVVFLAYQSVNHVTTITPGFMPEELNVDIASYVAVLPLNSDTIGYEQLPGPDYGTPVIEYVEDVSRRLPGGESAPRTVCMLQSEAVANINTFSFLSSTRENPYGFADLVVQPGQEGKQEIEALLSGCDFGLFVPQPKPAPGDESRLALVNATFVANFMTPQLLDLFKGPRRSFPVNSTPKNPAEPAYLSAGGRGDRVVVLVRERPPSAATALDSP